MLSTTEDTLRDLFNEHSDNGVDKVKKIKDYAFVHFATRDQAEAAMKSLDNTDIEGSTVEITWAKPVNKATYKAQKALSKELYPPASVRMNARGESKAN
jgi:RNA recognition motif-containing protein